MAENGSSDRSEGLPAADVPREVEHYGSVDELMRAHGLTDEPARFSSSIHSWRCEYPERYGACACYQELKQDIEAFVQQQVSMAIALTTITIADADGS